MAPDRVVPCAVCQNCVVREAFAQVLHHVAQVEVARPALVSQAREEVCARRLSPLGSMGAVDRLERACCREEVGRTGHDREVGLEDAPELLGVGMDVDERLRGPRGLERRIAACRDVAESRADDEQQVGVAESLG